MYLLRLKSKHHDQAQVVEDRDEAISKMRAWVGDHNKLDGCSTEAVVLEYSHRVSMSRQTSFGRREAYLYSQTGVATGVYDLSGS